MKNRSIYDVLTDFVEYKRTKNEEIIKNLSDELWYDWFCKDKSLVGKAKLLLNRLNTLVKANNNKLFDPRKCYVFFKNNCPVCGSLYDDFRICSMEKEEVIYTIVPSLGYDGDDYHKAEIFRVEDMNSKVLNSWKDITEYFKNTTKELENAEIEENLKNKEAEKVEEAKEA